MRHKCCGRLSNKRAIIVDVATQCDTNARQKREREREGGRAGQGSRRCRRRCGWCNNAVSPCGSTNELLRLPHWKQTIKGATAITCNPLWQAAALSLSLSLCVLSPPTSTVDTCWGRAKIYARQGWGKIFGKLNHCRGQFYSPGVTKATHPSRQLPVCQLPVASYRCCCCI